MGKGEWSWSGDEGRTVMARTPMALQDSSAGAGAGTRSRSITETVNGSHYFTINGYSLAKGMGVGKYIASESFTVGGYQWAIYFYPDGKNAEDNSLYVSVFIALASEGTDVRALFELTLLDQSTEAKHMVHSHFDRSLESGPYTLKYRGSMWGYKRFFRRAVLETSDFLKNDTLSITCKVGVVVSAAQSPKLYSISVPEPDLGQHFGALLDTCEGDATFGDVTFDVDGEVFQAHKLVLAARSPVFKAQLYGPMRDRNSGKIHVKDMEAPVFKAMLHFIYRDVLPDTNEITGSTSSSSTLMAQHLLTAADRYGLDRLRLLCESKLCEDVSTDTVATTLALAEQHHASQLKAVCLKYAATPTNLAGVLHSCPIHASALLRTFWIVREGIKVYKAFQSKRVRSGPSEDRGIEDRSRAMAAMRKEQRDIAELGPVGIVREGIKVYKTHAKVFLLVQGTLILPLALVVWGVSYYVASTLPTPPGPHNSRLGFGRFGQLRGAGPAVLPMFLSLLATSAYSLVLQLGLSLAQSTSVYSVGLHYTGQPVSYVDVLRAATPRLWMRMAVTNIWYWSFSVFISVVQALMTTFLTPDKVPIALLLFGTLVLLGTLVWLVFIIVAAISVGIVFMVTPGVSVLEDNYGWAAVGKSVKLLEGKKKTAFLFSLLWFVPTGIELGLGFALIYQLRSPGGFSAATGALFVLSNVAYLAWMTMIWQLQFLCSGVQYVSFKAFHNENLADPLPGNAKMNGGYAKVGDGSDAAMLDGKQPDNLV